MKAPNPLAKLHVLLVGNYLPDGQRSMQRFAAQLFDGLNAAGVTVELFHPPVIAGRLKSGTHGIGKWLSYIDKYLLSPITLRRRIRKTQQPVVVHICDHSNAHYTFALGKIPHLITCHDLLAVRSALGEFEQNRPSWTGRQQQAIILNGLKRCRQIATVSQATADDVIRIVNQPSQTISIIPNALDTPFIQKSRASETRDPVAQELLPFPVETPYVLSVGSDAWYKNRAGLLRVFASMQMQHTDLQLIVIGPNFDTETRIENGCETLSGSIHILNNISDAELAALYSGAKLLLFPSWIEGFGWPILEAQACGCAVMTLDRAPMNTLNTLQELCIPSALQTDAEITYATQQCLSYLQLEPANIAFKKESMKTFAAGFNTTASSTAYLKLYEGILNLTNDKIKR